MFVDMLLDIFIDLSIDIFIDMLNDTVTDILIDIVIDIVIDMFIEILKNIKEEDRVNIYPLIYYFERHIEVDSDEHGPLALEMVSELCGDNETRWNEAKIYSKKAMEMRIKLWDGIYSMIN